MTTTETIKVIAYAEHCSMQGRPASVGCIEELGEDSNDFVTREGTAAELLAAADELDSRKPMAIYNFRLAATIRKAVYFVRPELDPESDDCDE